MMTRVLVVTAGIIAFGCAADYIDDATTPFGNSNSEEAIVTASNPDALSRGVEIAATRCIQCHGPGFLPAFKRSRQEWLVTIDRMLSQYGGTMGGAASAPTLTQEERDILADYLAGR